MLYKPAYFLYHVLFDRMQQLISVCFYQRTLKSTLRGKDAIIVSIFKDQFFCCCFVSVSMLLDISLKGMSGKKKPLTSVEVFLCPAKCPLGFSFLFKAP